MVIRGYRVSTLLKRTGQEALEDDVLGLAAQTAYYFFFSLFPLFLFTAPLLGLLGDKERIVTALMDRASRAIPGEGLEMVENVVEQVVFVEGAPGLMSIGAVLALWTGSNVFNAMIKALNRAYDVEESRTWWQKRLVAIAAVVVGGVAILSATAVMLFGPNIARWVGGTLGMGELGVSVWGMVQYPLVFAMLVGALWALYYFLPNIRQDKLQVLVGAVAATILWVIVTLAFRTYVSNWGNFNRTYGTIGGVIVLLMWMYLSMLVMLVGGELNSELNRGTGEVDSRSGAVYAGRLATGTAAGSASTERVGA
jgi:membrane protein